MRSTPETFPLESSILRHFWLKIKPEKTGMNMTVLFLNVDDIWIDLDRYHLIMRSRNSEKIISV